MLCLRIGSLVKLLKEDNSRFRMKRKIIDIYTQEESNDCV